VIVHGNNPEFVLGNLGARFRPNAKRCTRLPESEYVLYQNLRNGRDRHVRIVFDDARLICKYNELLTFLKYDTQDTLAARKAIKKNVFISIYDFLEGKYECHKRT
jgi:hypothetical protein